MNEESNLQQMQQEVMELLRDYGHKLAAEVAGPNDEKALAELRKGIWTLSGMAKRLDITPAKILEAVTSTTKEEVGDSAPPMPPMRSYPRSRKPEELAVAKAERAAKLAAQRERKENQPERKKEKEVEKPDQKPVPRRADEPLPAWEIATLTALQRDKVAKRQPVVATEARMEVEFRYLFRLKEVIKVAGENKKDADLNVCTNYKAELARLEVLYTKDVVADYITKRQDRAQFTPSR